MDLPSARINGLDLFSGIGGISLALEPWVRPVAYCENDRYAQAVLLSRMADGELPIAPIWDDVRTLTGEKLARRLKKLSEDDVRDAVQLYRNGLSLAEVGKIFNVSRQSMWDLVRRRMELRGQKRFGNEKHFYRGGPKSSDVAQNKLEKAVSNGRMGNPGKCSKCDYAGTFKDGRTAIQAHHDDYNKPLEVRWLCQRCHHEWHKYNKPIERKGGAEGSQPVDIIYGGFP